MVRDHQLIHCLSTEFSVPASQVGVGTLVTIKSDQQTTNGSREDN